MRLFVGLGNPGPKYAGNRHNIGYMAVERIAGDHGFGPWRSKFQGVVSEGRLGSGKVLLLKPGTFMNLSGQSVGEAMRFYKLAPGDVFVFHDEIDLAPGKLRVKSGGGHAGHNGLRSLHSHIGDAYQRVRMGVGHPGRKEAVPGYVLHDFAKADEVWLDDLLRGISERGLAAGGAAPVVEGARAEGHAGEGRPAKGAPPGGQSQPASETRRQVQVTARQIFARRVRGRYICLDRTRGAVVAAGRGEDGRWP